jgi:cytochrome P450
VRQATLGTRTQTAVPSLKGYPLLGCLPRFWREPLSTLVNAQREGGDVVRIDLGTLRFYLLSRPDHVKWVLQENAENYSKGYDRVKVLLGNGLIMSEGASWLQQRRLMQPAFHQRRLEGFTAIMVKETQKTLEHWETLAYEGRTLDVAEEMKLLTQRIIVKTMFSTEVGAEDEIAWAFDTALLGIDVRSLMPRWFGWLPIPFNRRFKRALAILDEEVYRIICQRRRGGQGKGDDLVRMLMETRVEETGESMSDQQLRDEVMTIYLAGHETMANTLSWVWYLLSKNPEAARKVREEVSYVLKGRSPGFKDLPTLVYTRMVIDETLRLYPPAWIVSRRAIEDDELCGYRIPAGSRLMLSPYVTHRRAELWENPEGFDPERFASGNSNGRQRYAYYPFGGGPRQCIGNNFALMEATLVVSMVMQRYRLDLIPGQEVKAQPRSTLGPRPGVRVKLRAASSALPQA